MFFSLDLGWIFFWMMFSQVTPQIASIRITNLTRPSFITVKTHSFTRNFCIFMLGGRSLSSKRPLVKSSLRNLRFSEWDIGPVRPIDIIFLYKLLTNLIFREKNKENENLWLSDFVLLLDHQLGLTRINPGQMIVWP